MFNIDITLDFDASYRQFPQKVTAKQYDNELRVLRVKLTQNGAGYIPPEGSAVVLRGRKPDGTGIFVSSNAVTDGRYIFTLTDNALAVAGDILADVAVYAPGDDSADTSQPIISSELFHIAVTRAGYSKARLESSDEYTYLQELITAEENKPEPGNSAELLDNTVSFVAGGENYAIISVVSGEAVPQPADPPGDGSTFDGWYTEEEGGEKVAFPYVPDGDITLYAHWTHLVVIGVTGLTIAGSPSPDLTFTDDIAGVEKYSVSEDGTYVNVTNELDSYFPFCDISEFSDEDGNVFVRFPKFWMKWVLDGNNNIDGFKISNLQADDEYFVPDCFLDPSDGTSYLDYFALGKYEGSGSSAKLFSRSGENCLASITLADARTATNAYGTASDNYKGYQQLDFAMLVAYNLLCHVYYKTPNIQSVYGGRTGAVASRSSAEPTGGCDGLTGMNGWNTANDCVKMLGVENPYGNINKWVDGIAFSSATVYAQRLPQYYSGTTNRYALGFSRASAKGYISALRPGQSDETRSYVFCSSAGGSENSYYGDYNYYDAQGTKWAVGGCWSDNARAGLWGSYGVFKATSSDKTVGARLAYRPVGVTI